MKRLIGCLLALAALTLPAAALEPMSKPLSIYGYTYYAIDSAGTLWAWRQFPRRHHRGRRPCGLGGRRGRVGKRPVAPGRFRGGAGH